MTQSAERLDLRSEAAISAWLVQTLAELLERDGRSIDSHGKFADYGLDSVTGLQLVGHLEQEFGRSFDPSVLLAYPSVESLARFLARDA